MKNSIFRFPAVFNIKRRLMHGMDIFKQYDLPGEYNRFRQTYPLLKNEMRKYFKIESIAKRMDNLLDYNMIHSKYSRALIVSLIYKVMKSQDQKRDNEIIMLPQHVLGWIIELHHNAFVILDDYIDEGSSRRGKAPWYLEQERFVSCDVLLLLSATNLLFMDHFHDAPFNHSGMKLIQDTMVLDQTTNQSVEMFLRDIIQKKCVTWEFYNLYLTLKCGYLAIGPFKLAFFLALNSDVNFGDDVEKILNDICYLGGVVDDGMEFFECAGKCIDEDIKMGKLTWFLVYVMQNASEEDVSFLATHYGNRNDRDTHKVVSIFNKFDLKTKYAECRKVLIDSIRKDIDNLSASKEIFKHPLTLILNGPWFFDPSEKPVPDNEFWR